MSCKGCGKPVSGDSCSFCNTIVSTDRDSLLGTDLGSYRVESVLGEGGMGRVYLATHPTIGSRVAIKVLSSSCAGQPELVERFFAEAKAVNLIRHECIVNVLDLATLPDGRPYIVMEHLAGAPLSAIVQRSAPLPLGSAARMIGEVLSALAAAHAKGIIHRDLKPDNIFVSPQGRAKVLDFGIAKLKPELQEGGTPTQTGAILGTPDYMAPEQALGRSVDRRCDLYSLGIILFECVTGERPFRGSSLYEVLHQQINEPLPDPRTLRPEVPAAYAEMIRRAGEKNPDHRFATAEEFLAAISDATSDLVGAAWHPIGSDTSPTSARVAALATPKTPPARVARDLDVQTAPTLGGAGSPTTGHLAPSSPPGRGWLIPVGIFCVALAGTTVAGVATGWFGSAPSSGDDTQPTPPDQLGSPPSSPSRGTPKVGDEVADALATPEKLPEKPPGPLPRDDAKPIVKGDHLPRRPSDGQPDLVEAAMRKAGMIPLKGLNYDAFDIDGYRKEAARIATSFYDDARFTRLDASGVRPDGKASLTLQPGDFTVIYRFVSPAHAKRPKNLPLGVDHKPNCMIYIFISPQGSWAKVIEGTQCEDTPIVEPGCSMKDVWRWAVTRKGVPNNAVASISYFRAGTAPKFSFSIPGTDHSFWVPQDCK